MSNIAHVGDIGTIFEVTITDRDGVAINLATASTLSIIFAKPSGATVTKTATLSGDGTDGKIRYASIADDLDVPGVWQLQGFVIDSSYENYSDTTTFQVRPNL